MRAVAGVFLQSRRPHILDTRFRCKTISTVASCVTHGVRKPRLKAFRPLELKARPWPPPPLSKNTCRSYLATAKTRFIFDRKSEFFRNSFLGKLQWRPFFLTPGFRCNVTSTVPGVREVTLTLTLTF